MLKYIVILFLIAFRVSHCYLNWEIPNTALDEQLYKDVLDPELCAIQLDYLKKDPLLLARFLDSSMRPPRGILTGNINDFGNYFECLGINKDIANSTISGKHCMLSIPFMQDKLVAPVLSAMLQGGLISKFDENINDYIRVLNGSLKYSVTANWVLEKLIVSRILKFLKTHKYSSLEFKMALCVPRACSTQQAIDTFYNLTAARIVYTEEYCRLPNDKPWVAADYIAIVVLIVISLLTIFSTAYDLILAKFYKKDPKSVNQVALAFSIYRNSKDLTTFKSNPYTLEAVDGLRVISMMWIMVVHTFLWSNIRNPLNLLDWTQKFDAVWITSSSVSVDTFFMISGLFVTYCTVGKFTKKLFIRNLHLFYIYRLMRLLPVLAMAVLLQASIFNRVSDGPNWSHVVMATNRCRVYWWATLTMFQNYICADLCLDHSWFLAIDFQLYLISPLVLYWVFGSRKSAWTALISSFVLILVAALIFNYFGNFPSTMFNVKTLRPNRNYSKQYYINTLTRAPVFIVGMIFGYVLAVSQGKKLALKWYFLLPLWALSFVIFLGTLAIHYPILQIEWNNRTVDYLINSFLRPAWGCAVGWVIFACAHGYGGPINWLLSLRLWKIPSRLCYCLYLLHFPINQIINSSMLTQRYFSVSTLMYINLGNVALTFLVSFVVAVLVEYPAANLMKLHLMQKKAKILNQQLQEKEQDIKGTRL